MDEDDNYDVESDDDDDNYDVDGAVETDASWSPTGQWHILCYSVTRDVIY